MGVLILVFILVTSGCAADQLIYHVKNSSEHDIDLINGTTALISDTWSRKLSSDLLQLLDASSCSPGRTPNDTAHDMQVLGLLKYGSDQNPVVRVIIRLNNNAGGERIIPYLNQTVTDPSSGMISGWIAVSLIPDVAGMPEVRQLSLIHI